MICDVCGNAEVAGVCCSGLGPVSFAYCQDCLVKGAEPYFMLDAIIENVGIDCVAPWVEEFAVTFINGHYMSWKGYIDFKGQQK